MVDDAIGKITAFGEHATYGTEVILMLGLPDEAVFIYLLSYDFCLASRSASSVAFM